MSDIGDRIRDLRRAREMSLRQLAEVSKVSHNQIHKYEKGMSVPNRATIMALAEVFAVAPTWLLFGREIEKTESDSIQEAYDLLQNDSKILIKNHITRLLALESVEGSSKEGK